MDFAVQDKLNTIGPNIRKCRRAKGLRQEDLAEMANLSPNYVGMVERGEKIPALDTFITIINALNVSADVILADIIRSGYQVKISRITEEMEKLSERERRHIFEIIELLLKQAKENSYLHF